MRAQLFAVAVLFFAPQTAWAAAHDLPDPTMTPGASDPSVTQGNIKTTICVSGYTDTVRPPSSVTDKLKAAQLNDPKNHYTDRKMGDYEEDHLISLELGGAPRDPKNLWPEHYAGVNGARVKDQLESRLKRLICDGTVTLKEAQDAIAKNWITAYRKYIH